MCSTDKTSPGEGFRNVVVDFIKTSRIQSLRGIFNKCEIDIWGLLELNIDIKKADRTHRFLKRAVGQKCTGSCVGGKEGVISYLSLSLLIHGQSVMPSLCPEEYFLFR